MKYIFFLFEPLNYLYQQRYGTTEKLFQSSQNVYSRTNETPKQNNSMPSINSLFNPSILENITNDNVDGKIAEITQYLKNNQNIPDDIKELIKNKLIKALNDNNLIPDTKEKINNLIKSDLFKEKIYGNKNKHNNEINKNIEKMKSLKNRGPDYHLLRGLLGSIGVDSDLLKMLEETPFTNEDIKRIENTVIERLTDPTKRTEIIEKLKELHRSNRGILEKEKEEEGNMA